MPHRTFKNFQPGDWLKAESGEQFEIIERETYYCKNCQCTKSFCKTFQERTTLWIKSQRGIWEMSLKMLNEKYQEGKIKESKR